MMRTFQFDLYEAILWKGAKSQWSAVHPVSLVGDRSRGSSRLKIKCVETKMSLEPMNFSDLMDIVDCWMDDYTDGEREGDWSSNIISLSRKVVLFTGLQAYLRPYKVRIVKNGSSSVDDVAQRNQKVV